MEKSKKKRRRTFRDNKTAPTDRYNNEIYKCHKKGGKKNKQRKTEKNNEENVKRNRNI